MFVTLIPWILNKFQFPCCLSEILGHYCAMSKLFFNLSERFFDELLNLSLLS